MNNDVLSLLLSANPANLPNGNGDLVELGGPPMKLTSVLSLTQNLNERLSAVAVAKISVYWNESGLIFGGAVCVSVLYDVQCLQRDKRY